MIDCGVQSRLTEVGINCLTYLHIAFVKPILELKPTMYSIDIKGKFLFTVLLEAMIEVELMFSVSY